MLYKDTSCQRELTERPEGETTRRLANVSTAVIRKKPTSFTILTAYSFSFMDMHASQ